VNGGIDIGSGVHADDVTSVNGSVHVGSDGTIDGELSVVNGRISVDSGTTVKRDVSNVNGEIQISGAEVGGNIETVAGDVVLENGAVLHGDINIEKPGNWSQSWTHNKPTIVIGPGCRVDGTIRIEHEVKLYISNTATVGNVTGVMSMDDAVHFDGARP
jgi:cytoskeletal protein CcmA (bactofilin family)